MSSINKKLVIAFSSIKNIFNNEKYSKLSNSYLLFKSKATSFSFFKEFNWLNYFSYDYKIVKFCLHKANASKLIDFLINFFDNIVRDSTALFNKNYSDGNSYVYCWNLTNLKIVINKIKKILKYFFYFIDYYSISSLSFFLVSYSYFKLSLSLKLAFLGFLNSSKKFSSCYVNKSFKFDYLLINKTINKNYLIRYSNNEWFQKSYKNAYKSNKLNYVNFLKNLKKNKLDYIKKRVLGHLLLKLKSISKLSFINNNFLAVNFFNISLFYVKRSCYYQKFLINKIYFFKNNQKNKNFIKKISYIKNFAYFKNNESSQFYRKFHLNCWDYGILNIFNYKTGQQDLQDYVKSNYIIFQSNYFTKLLWSWHLIFVNSNQSPSFLLKNFNYLNLENSFNGLFYKIYKLRAILDYLLFITLPLNFNLVWAESISQSKSLFRSNTIAIISKKVRKDSWFFKNNTVLKKIKNFIISKLNRSVQKTKKFIRLKFIKTYYKSIELSRVQKISYSKNFINFKLTKLKKHNSRRKFQSYLNTRSFNFLFKFKFRQFFIQKNNSLLPLLSLKLKNLKVSLVRNIANLNNAYRGNADFFRNKNIFLSCKLPNRIKATSFVFNNNFIKKNSYGMRSGLTGYNLFSTMSPFRILSFRLMPDIKLPSRAYQNVMLFNIVKNKELLHQVSYLYEFEALMFDLNLSVYQNKLKKVHAGLSFMYNNVSLILNNLCYNFLQLSKFWYFITNINYLSFTTTQLYLLSKVNFSKNLLFA